MKDSYNEHIRDAEEFGSFPFCVLFVQRGKKGGGHGIKGRRLVEGLREWHGTAGLGKGMKRITGGACWGSV
jgi:hypothetical protein